VIRKDSWNNQYLLEMVEMLVETYHRAAEAEDSPANGIPWYEERVRAFKSLEQFFEKRFQQGTAPQQDLNFVRFFRYQAEADLLRLKDDVAATGNTHSRPFVTKDFPAFLRDTKLPVYTAFPDLKTPPPPKSREENPFADQPDDPWAGLPELPTDASPLRKAQFARAQAGWKYLFGMHEVIRIGSWSQIPLTVFDIDRTVKPNLAIADMEEPANRVRGYERTVARMKDHERYFTIRAELGTVPPYAIEFAMFGRLEAEAILIQLKDQIAKSGAKPTPPGKRTLITAEERKNLHLLKEPTYTAFPELKPPAVEFKQAKDFDGTTYSYLTFAESTPVPIPALPTLTTDAPLLRKVLLAQTREGLAYLETMYAVIRVRSWNQQFFSEVLLLVDAVFPVAAELEEVPAKRIPWCETRVRTLKGIEIFIADRVKNGTAPPQDFYRASFVRLQAEADLLKLKAKVSPPPTYPMCEPIYYPPACVQPRARLLPRLFRR
jgi:hypothetical protein